MKILVEKAVIEQALEALEIYGEHFRYCPQYPTYTRPQDYPKCDCGFEEAIAALRKAIAEPELNLNCKSVQKRLATVWGYVKAEQAEQEPVAYVYEKDVAGIGMRKDVAFTKHVEVGTDLYAAPVQQAEQEPIGEVDPYMDFLRINWKDDKHPPRGTKLYAAPVRTKDLTDEEIEWLVVDTLETWNSKDTMKDFARAVIAKFKEKNK